MRLGTKVVRQSSRLQNRGVEDGECSRRTRSIKKKGRALSPFRLNFGKRPRSSVNLSEAIGSKSDSDSDFDCMYGKGKAEVVEVDARIQLSSRFLKIWDFYYDENTRNFHGKATYWNDYTVPEKIVNKLTRPQFQLFMRTPFSHFMKLGQPKMYSQIIHQALIREIYQRDYGEIWFEFGEKRVRFGLPEFCLISGMNGLGNSDVSGYSGKESVLVAKYFGESRVTRAFIRSVYEEASFDNDEEVVRLSAIYLLFNFLLAAAPARYVDMDLLTYAAIGDLNVFPWGKICFDQTVRSLSIAVSREEIKIMLDERLKPLEDSISSVKESTHLLKKDVREQLQFFEGNIIKQIKDLLRVVCPDKCSNVNNCERDKLCDEVPLENACLDCLVCGGKYKSCDHGPVNVTHSCELNESHTCDAVGKDFSDPNVEKLSKVTESENEPTVIVKESFSVARDLEGKKQSDVVSNVISGVVRGSKDQKAREFPSFELLSQESLSNGQHLDCEKSLDIVGEGNANVENEEQESSPNSKSHFDDIIFTTQDIKMIEEMEHSVTKKDVVGKRAAVKSAVLRSPYTTDFGSADCKELVLYPKDIRKGISAFPDECMKFPNVSEVLLVYKFPGSSDNINPPFSFGDIRISSKMWFYLLLTPNKWINDDHINIAFYYLRKLARHSPKVRVKVTIVDLWFHVKITNLYKEYIMKCFHKYVLREETDIREYVLGYSMCINTPWAEVDYVLFPINMDKPGHCFLLIFDIRRRALVLYNTLEQSSVVMKSKLKEVCEPYVFALPIILSGCGFWKSRNDIDRTSSSFTKYGLDGPLELEVAKAVPEQVECDCGIFTIGFAEHFIFQKMEDMLTRFSVKAYRKKLCVNLYVHASNKEVCGYESDIEHPGRYIA
ncbi:hypothetical protein OROHE_023858 [Orobanche hederae]